MKKKNLILIEDFKNFNYKKNFIFSALNLAFLAYLFTGNIKPSKNLFLWCDGIAGKIFFNSKKIPGNKFLSFFFKYKFKEIMILGNCTKKQKNFLKKKFKTKVVGIQLPIINQNNIKKYAPKIKKNSIVIITLPTPKQEMLSEYIKKKNKFYKILCIGGGLEIASGEVKPCPKFISNLGLEFIWRLRTDTFRRLKRLFFTFFIFIIKFFSGEIKKYKILKF